MEERSKRRKPPLQLDIGKMPPQAVEFEEAVIGAILLEKDTINEIIGVLKPESFYKEAHSIIFNACFELYKESNPIDMMTVTQQLKKTGELDVVGGGYYLSVLTNKISSAANVEYHARIIAQKYMQRELIRVSTEAIQRSYEEDSDVFDLLDNAEKNLYAISHGSYKKNASKSSTLANKVVAEMEAISQRPDGLSGIPSGLIELDKITGGWQKSDLIIIAARPAMGKTALAVSIGKNAAMRFNIPTAIYSLEMSETQLMRRVISAEAEINSYQLKRPKSLSEDDWGTIRNAVGNISNAPLFIDDTPSLSVFELRAKARRMKEKDGIQLIIVDYLQLMTAGIDTGKSNREQEISFISRSLKALAKDLEIPVIALSQLSRAVESRGGDKKPQLSDLRESGAIEQDADIVIFPHRPEYYGITQDGDGNSTVGLGELIIAKHREGATDTAIVKYVAQYTKFCDVEDSFGLPDISAISPNRSFHEPTRDIEEDLPF